MKSVRKRLFGFIVLLMLILLPVPASAGGLKLTLVVNNNGGYGLGHSFLVVRNSGKKAVSLSGYRIASYKGSGTKQ